MKSFMLFALVVILLCVLMLVIAINDAAAHSGLDNQVYPLAMCFSRGDNNTYTMLNGNCTFLSIVNNNVISPLGEIK